MGLINKYNFKIALETIKPKKGVIVTRDLFIDNISTNVDIYNMLNQKELFDLLGASLISAGKGAMLSEYFTSIKYVSTSRAYPIKSDNQAIIYHTSENCTFNKANARL